MGTELLDIVDENDVRVGQAPRAQIHAEGLLHREIWVLFVTPEGQVIFQRRGAHKDTFPNLLDATVGGHVELGDSYEATALKESEEETGVVLSADDLELLVKVKGRAADPVTGRINHAFRAYFVHRFTGRVEDLRVEDGDGAGFEVWPLQKILEGDAELLAQSVPAFADPRLIDALKVWSAA